MKSERGAEIFHGVGNSKEFSTVWETLRGETSPIKKGVT